MVFLFSSFGISQFLRYNYNNRKNSTNSKNGKRRSLPGTPYVHTPGKSAYEPAQICSAR
jgi:hypothetical protein